MLNIKNIARFLAIFLALNQPNAFAETAKENSSAKTYQVEILAFKNITPPADSEAFPDYPVLPQYQGTIELSQPSENTIVYYKKLPREKFTLNKEESLIARKGDYQILLHDSWLQKQDEELAVHLINKLSSSDLFEGTLHIKRAYYYQANFAFDLQSPSTNGSSHYVLNSSRNLKNSELHFIDHPKFGILLKITTL